jgi:beta-lactamase regulating signal transducer with metallopeptidase domain
MSSSLILTNCLFCGLAAILVCPILRQPNILTHKKGIPIFFIVILVFIKTFIPYEFTFTHTFASKNILPTIKKIEELCILGSLNIKDVFICAWIVIALLLLGYIVMKYEIMMRILSIVPEIKSEEIMQILSEICIQNQIKRRPKIIQLDINTGPFIVGFSNPVIVLPAHLHNDEVRFVLMHELEHFKNHHLIIKILIEVVTSIYWWNPFIWLFRKEAISALEVQADAYIIQCLSRKERLSYLEALVKVTKEIRKQRNSNLSLSFAIKNSMVEHRVFTALKFNNKQDNNKRRLLYSGSFMMSIVLLTASVFFTFEAYSISPENVKGTFVINSSTSYFILSEDKSYDLYVNEEYISKMSNIPDELSNIPIREE